jgi:hypothetical protein
MRYRLLLTVACLALERSAVRAQAWNFGSALTTEGKAIIRSESDLRHEFEYAWRNTKVVLEFSQYDCQFSVTEENTIPDAATKTALTMLFEGICDLGTFGAGPTQFSDQPFPREKIEEILVGDRVAMRLFKFDD